LTVRWKTASAPGYAIGGKGPGYAIGGKGPIDAIGGNGHGDGRRSTVLGCSTAQRSGDVIEIC